MGVAVKKSKINKSGVFAIRFFHKGEVVLKWNTSHRVNTQDVSQSKSSNEQYFHPFDDVISFIVQSPECYVNHCCDNNTEVADFSDIAVRDINIGEEITSNYETDGAGLSFVCDCGSENCRKIIGCA